MSDDWPCGNSREGYPPVSDGACQICTSAHAGLPPHDWCQDCGHCHIAHGKA